MAVRVDPAVSASERIRALAKKSELAASLYLWVLLIPEGVAAHGIFEEDAQRLSLGPLAPFRTVVTPERLLRLMNLYETFGLVKRYTDRGRKLVAITRFRSNGAKAPAGGWRFPLCPGLADEEQRWNVPKEEARAIVPVSEISVEAVEILAHYKARTGKGFRVFQAEKAAAALIQARLREGWKPADLRAAVDGALKDPHYVAGKYLEPGNLWCNAARIEKLLAVNRSKVERTAPRERTAEEHAEMQDHFKKVEALRALRLEEEKRPGYEDFSAICFRARHVALPSLAMKFIDLVFVAFEGDVLYIDGAHELPDLAAVAPPLLEAAAGVRPEVKSVQRKG